MVDRFSGLHCRPGNLAVIVQDVPECRANIGQIVRVLCEYTELPDEMGFHWLVEPQSSQPSPVLVGISGKIQSVLVYDNANRAQAVALYTGRRRIDPAGERSYQNDIARIHSSA